MNSIEEIILKVWGNTFVTYEPLNGGLVNFNYKVSANENEYVLRINGKQNNYLGLNRGEEIKVFSMSADMGIAPMVLPQSTHEYLITEYISAPMLTREEICRPSMIDKSIEILKKIHGIKGVNRTITPFDLLDKYLKGMEKLNVPFTQNLNDCLAEVDQISKRWDNTAKYCRAYCHNDFFILNILNAYEKLYILDWELSGEGDIFFDLATISFSNAFSEELDAYMLQCYFGDVETEHHIALRDMKYMNMLREATWSLLHSGMDESPINHSMDYFGWGNNVLTRIKEGYLYL